MQPATAAPAPFTPSRFYDPRRAVGRLLWSSVAGGVAVVAIPADLGWAIRSVGAWCAAATVLLFSAWSVILGSNVEQTRHRCANDDPGRFLVWIVVLAGSAFSMFAAVGLTQHSKDVTTRGGVLVALCLGAVACAWCLTHTAFTLRYAHLYYRDDGNGEGGLTFPGTEPPDDLDFAYFAFTLGTCFQTSDVSITERLIRRTALVHAVLSFLFNTAILALVLNLVFGRFG